MELSYFLSMVQYEVLKSFDFNSYMQDELGDAAESPIQLAIQAAEVEIPVLFDTKEKEIDLKKIDQYIANHSKHMKTNIEIPFSSSISKLKVDLNNPKGKQAEHSGSKKQKGIDKSGKSSTKQKGRVISVQVANQRSKIDETFDPNLIGKIKLIIKPVVK